MAEIQHPNEQGNDASQQPPSVNPAIHASGTTSGRSSLGKSVWFAFKAVEIRLRFVAILVGIGLVIGYWDTIKNYADKWTRPTAASVAALTGGEEFFCPMHPSVVRDKLDPSGAMPKCPICGMPLSKRKKGESAQLPEGIISRVQLSPYRIELAGIKTVEAKLQPLTLDVRTVGYVTVDERKLSRIVVRAAGYVEKLYVNESFVVVVAGEPLAQIYSPDLYSAAQELLIARRGKASDLAEFAHEKLQLLGVAKEEIDEIIRAGKAESRLVIRAPQSGHVFEKRIVEGDHIEAGQMLFEVADLSTVWIEGEVYEQDAAMLKTGQAVEASLEAIPGRVFKGRLSLVHPHVEPSTRTVRVRFELENPKHDLRPGMFATVSLKSAMQTIEPFRSQLAAQRREMALSNASSQKQEPNKKGAANDNTLRPVDDLSLIALQKVCPVTGARLGSMGKPLRENVDGRTVFLCCAGCQEKLAAKPEFYLGRLRTVSEEGVLAVPEQSVIDTGIMKIVYVEREPGLFEGIAVTLGPATDGYYPVIDGLLPGDRVAAAGSFLVDAETRLNPAAAAAFFGASGTPAGSGESAPSGATRAPRASANGPAGKERANLEKLPAADRKLAEQQQICPITDLRLGSMGVPIKMMVQGQPLFVCCEGCQDGVNKDPQSALAKIRAGKSPTNIPKDRQKKSTQPGDQ